MTIRDYVVAGIIGLIAATIAYVAILGAWGTLWSLFGIGPVRYGLALIPALLIGAVVGIALLMIGFAAQGV